MVVPVSATGEVKATFKGTVGGTVPAGCKFEITIDNSENKEVTVTALKEGSWKVSLNGEEKVYNVF